MASSPPRSYSDLSDLERKINFDLFDLLKSHAEVRAYREQLLYFLSPKGFLSTIKHGPREVYYALNDLIQMGKYSLSRANASWALDPFGRDTLIFTLEAGAYNMTLFFLSPGSVVLLSVVSYILSQKIGAVQVD